jgi:cell division protein FtsB
MKLLEQFPRFRLTGVTLVNAVGVVIVIYLVVVLGQTVKKNYDLGLQIKSMQLQMAMIQTQNDELSYNIQYYKTNSFKDREARSQLGLQLPGENVVIIPGDNPSPTPLPTPVKAAPQKSNYQQWVSFLSGSS